MPISLLLSTATLQFLAAYMVVAITPGPVALATGSLASLHGFAKTIPLVAGISAGTALLVAIIALGAVHLGASLSLPIVKIAGATVLGWMALRIARTALPATPPSQEPRRLQVGLFAEGFLVSFLSPEAASFFAVAFVGLMLPIRDFGEALTVAVITAILDAGWYGLVALALSRHAIRAVVTRRHRAISTVAAAVLGLIALSSALSAFSIE
jgi:cysteine/O-acetylserine efflux protein